MKAKIDLDLLKKLVTELEGHLARAASLEDGKENNNNIIVEMSKAYGLAAQVAQEATFLTGDIRTNIRTKSAGTITTPAGQKDITTLSEDELMNAIFGPVKGSDDSKN